MIDPFNINSIPLPTPDDGEDYDLEFVWEPSAPTNPATLTNPPTGAMALIPQIWADILEKSLRKQMDILYQLPFAHI